MFVHNVWSCNCPKPGRSSHKHINCPHHPLYGNPGKWDLPFVPHQQLVSRSIHIPTNKDSILLYNYLFYLICIVGIWLRIVLWSNNINQLRRCAGTRWVSVRAGDLDRSNFCCCIVISTPRHGIFILDTNASIKCRASKCEWEDTVITSIRVCPECKKSIVARTRIPIVRSKSHIHRVCTCNDGEWCCFLSTILFILYLYPVKWAGTVS